MSLEKFNKKKLLLAVSGGIDSIYMYHKILNSKDRHSYDIGLAHVNYNTSPISSKAYLLCLELAKNNNHPFYGKSVSLDTNNDFENNARNLRYSFFKSITEREGYDYILIAHTRDDLIETLYMRSGVSNDFSSLPFNRSQDLYKRPILNKERKQIIDETKKKKYKYYDDPTNLDTKYKRNNIRHRILPNLIRKDKVVNQLLESYDINRQFYKDFLSKYEKLMKNHISYKNRKITIPKSILIQSSNYSMKLIIQGSVKDYFNVFVTKTHKFWAELYEIIKSDKINVIKSLSDDIIISFNKSNITINRIIESDICKKIKHKTKWMDYTFTVAPYENETQHLNDRNTFICPESIYKSGLYVRKWIDGDKYPISNKKNKQISKLFNENKVNRVERKQYPIVTNGDTIKWIPGVVHSNNCYLESDKLILITANR